MTRKKRRVVLIVAGFAMTGLSSALALWAFQTHVTFFMSPDDVAKNRPEPGRPFKLGGLVKVGSFHAQPDAVSVFAVTDCLASVQVRYRGILPDLFREGQGVVAQGEIGPDGIFTATDVLAKHDEKYMPPEVADALKKSGRWQEQGMKPNGAPCT
jgi:cytochrome c-type biogenesis protein CcmE